MAPYQSFKLHLVETIGLSKIGFHFGLGLLVYFLIVKFFRINFASIKSLVAPVIFALLMELMDLRDALFIGNAIAWRGSLEDIGITVSAPFVIYTGLQFYKYRKQASVVITLPLIPKPAENTRSVLMFQKDALIKGQADTDLICGGCGKLLCNNISESQVLNIVIGCSKCNLYNEIPSKWKFRLTRLEDRLNKPIFFFGILLSCSSLVFNIPILLGLMFVMLSAFISLHTKKIIQFLE